MLFVLAVIITIIVCITLLLLSIHHYRSRFLRGAEQREIRQAWRQVECIDSPTLQIMEADKVLDLALRKLHYTGTLGEKLKRAGGRFSQANEVWQAHRIRNRIAHEMGATLHENERRKALRVFAQALRELGM